MSFEVAIVSRSTMYLSVTFVPRVSPASTRHSLQSQGGVVDRIFGYAHPHVPSTWAVSSIVA